MAPPLQPSQWPWKRLPAHIPSFSPNQPAPSPWRTEPARDKEPPSSGEAPHGAPNYRGTHPWLSEHARHGFSGSALWALAPITRLRIPPGHSRLESQQEVTLCSIPPVPVSPKPGQCPLLLYN